MDRRERSQAQRQRRDAAHTTLDVELAEAIRASFLLAGPLLARFGQAIMPPPGGDVIGRRRLEPHLDAFSALGATYEHGREITISAAEGRLRAGTVFMDEPSVMATENALLAAALTPGVTTIGNAACEPHVQDLARMLVAMGADITGIGSNVLIVHGKDELGGCQHEVGPDHIEIGSFMALAGVTGGELRIERVDHDDLRMIRLAFEKLGLHSVADGDDLVVPGEQQLIAKRDVGEHKMKVQDGPWPAFPADLTSIAVALATQCSGSVLIHEWMFENRLVFTDKLVLMGADITLCDPHRAIVNGPARLRGQRVESPDIRAGMAMLIAAACAGRRVADLQHPADRPGIRAHRRSPPSPRHADRAPTRLDTGLHRMRRATAAAATHCRNEHGRSPRTDDHRPSGRRGPPSPRKPRRAAR